MLARVSGLCISETEVNRLADTPELQQTLASLVESHAQQLGVNKTEGETAQRFYDRVTAAAEQRGRLTELEGEIDAELERARLRALMTLVNIATLKGALSSDSVTALADEGLPPAVLELRLLEHCTELVAREQGLAPDDLRIQERVEGMLAQAFESALWAPYQSVLETALAGYSEQERQQIMGFLAQKYFPVYGVKSIARLSQEIRTHGPAAELLALVRATGRLQWTVADLDAAGRIDHRLGPLVDELLASVPDRLAHGLTPVDIDLVGDGLAATSSEVVDNPIFAQLETGGLALGWVPTPSGLELGILSEKPGCAVDPELASVTADQICAYLTEVGQALRTSGKALAEVLAASPIAAFLPADGVEFAIESPPVARVLHAAVLAHALDGATWESVRQQLADWGIPSHATSDLRELWTRASALVELQPLPTAVRDALCGHGEVRVPLQDGAKTSAAEREAIAAVQRILIAMGALTASEVRVGVLDATTLRQLRTLSPSGGDVFVLNQQTALALLASAATMLPVEEHLLGDLVIRHPALCRHRAHGGTAQPLRLVLEYLKAQGFDVAADPPRVDTTLCRALAQSLELPFDSEALRAAEAQLARMPALPSEEVERAFSTRIAVVGSTNRAFVVAGEATAEECAALLNRITAAAVPQAERGAARSDLGMLPLKEPVVALKLAVSKLAGTPLPVDADGVIQATLTAPEVLALRDMVHADSDPSAASFEAWTRVAKCVHEGRLVLADLSRDFAGQTPMDQDANLVLGQLRQVVQAIRMSTLPTDRAQSAVALHEHQFDPVSQRQRPLLAAQQIMAQHVGSSPPDARRAATLRPEDLDHLAALEQTLAQLGGTDAAAREAQGS